MKLFIREHILLIIVQCLQMIFFTAILLLAGMREYTIIAYGIFISFLILLLYLLYMYVSRRHFYKKMSNPIATMDYSLERLDDAPIANYLQELLKTQYNAYETEKFVLEKKQEEYFMFLDRWIHQMKTPVSVMNLMAKELDEPASSSFQEEVDRLQTGLNMVLYLSRVRTMAHDFHIRRISLLHIVQAVSKEHKRLFIRNKVYPNIQIPADAMVETDEKWFEFILTQFIENAVKYSATYSNTVDITYTVNDKEKVLSIQDYGVGIPSEDLTRIFDSFYTGANGRVFRESTGIGLYLVREVCTYLGHRIEVESEVGKGTVFHIIF